LESKRAEIDAALGTAIEWREMAEKKASRIVAFKEADPYDEAAWPGQFAWLRATLERFDTVFRPLLRDVQST